MFPAIDNGISVFRVILGVTASNVLAILTMLTQLAVAMPTSQAQSLEWVQRSTPGPSPRYGHAAAYDIARGFTVISGGSTSDPLNPLSHEVWKWNGASWLFAGLGPSPRYYHPMVFDTVRNVMVVFGGYVYSGVGPSDDTWEWNGVAPIWMRRSVDGPSRRSGHAMAYDAARGVTVLFGGGAEVTYGDTWVWNGTMWTQRIVRGPSPRSGHAMAYDAGRGVTVLFGGGNDVSYGDTWEWNGASWTQLAISGVRPSPRAGHAMAYDSARGVTVLFGGDVNGETWEWNGTVWSRRMISGPSARYSPAMAYDGTRGVIVLFGGYNANFPYNLNGDTWELRSSPPPTPIRWTNPFGGIYSNAANWSTNTVPGPNDDIIFDLPGTYTVTLTQNQTVRSAQFNAGNVTLAGPQRELAVTNDVQVPGNLKLLASTVRSSGAINIASGGTLTLRPVSATPFELQASVHSGTSGFNIAGTLEGAGDVHGDVRVVGTLYPSQGTSGTLSRSISIHGDLTFTVAPATPRFKVDVLSAFPWVSSVYVDGTVSLGGAIEMVTSPGFTPPVGGRYAVISVLSNGEIDRTTRFASQSGLAFRLNNNEPPRIDPSRFICVNHGFLERNDHESPVELCVVEGPQIFRSTGLREWLGDSLPFSGGRDLMFITHGTMSDIPDEVEPESFAELADKAARFAAAHGRGTTQDVVTLDWGDFSTSIFLGNYNPKRSARIGREIAESLTTWLREREYDYDTYHLLSHSSGSWLIDRFAEALIRNGFAETEDVSLTFFDTFYHPDLFPRPQEPNGVQIGLAALYSEQYVDVFSTSPPWTDAALPGMLNLDVTNIFHIKLPPVTAPHAWPYQWYIRTMPLPTDPLPTCSTPVTYWGFMRSPLAQSVVQVGSGCRGNPDWHILRSDPILLPYGTRRIPPFQWIAGLIDSYEPGTTGTVEIDQFGTVRLHTGSPAWVEVTYDLPAASEYIRFSYRFTSPEGSGANGQFNVSVHGDTFADATEVVDGPDIHQTGSIYLRRVVGPGPITIEFRLDPQTPAQSSIEITGIEFGMLPCRGDFNQDNFVNSQDFFDFLAAFFGLQPAADFNHDTFINSQDFFDFLAAFFAGC